MRVYALALAAMGVLLADDPRLVAKENPDQKRTRDALPKLGVTFEVDANLPGHPVIAVDLDHSDVHGDTLKLLKTFPHLYSVKWREGWSIGQEDMKLLGSLTQLRNLDIWACHIQDDWLKHLEGLINLESLTLFWGETFTGEGLRHIRRLTNLRTLNLHNGIKITDKGLVYLRGLTNLSCLDLGGTEISDDGLICLKTLRHLETLSLSDANISDKGLAHIAELTALQSLDLSHTRITDKGLEHLKGLNELRSLNIDAQDINGEGLEQLQGLAKLRTLRVGANIQGSTLLQLKGLKQLRELAFASARFGDEDWKHLGDLTDLECLEIDRARFVTSKGLEHLGRLTNLRELQLNHIEHMTDKSLRCLAGLTNLRHLRLSHLSNIGDAGMRHLKQLTNLESLELGSLTITDGLKVLEEFRNLRKMSLRYMAVTDEFKTLSNLQELDLHGASLGDAELMHLKQLTNLRTLDLSATYITNRGLSRLKGLRSLKTIYVEDTNVTDTGIENFRQARPGTKAILYTANHWVYNFVPPRQEKPASERLTPLVHILADCNDAAVQLDVLRGMYEALQGRRSIIAPEGWSAVYRKLSESTNAEVREKVLQLSVLFGDPQALAALRQTAADPKVDALARRNALQTLVEKRPPDLLPLLRKLVGDRVLRGSALRGLAFYGDAATPALILEHYAAFTDAEKTDAVATLASRPKYALALLDAMEKGRVPRRDLSAFTVRQLLAFKDKNLSERLTKVWGSIRPPSQEKTAQLAKYKALVPADALKKADRKHGRLLFSRTCANCHTLFGEGGKIGPDLTGSQRTNPEYLLTKLLDPSAVVARDYQMTVLTTKSGRTLSGLVKEESEKTLTLQTQNEVVRLEKSDIEERNRSPQSMMPDGLLAMLRPAEVRDLIAYLSGAGQVPLPPEPRK